MAVITLVNSINIISGSATYYDALLQVLNQGSMANLPAYSGVTTATDLSSSIAPTTDYVGSFTNGSQTVSQSGSLPLFGAHTDMSSSVMATTDTNFINGSSPFTWAYPFIDPIGGGPMIGVTCDLSGVYDQEWASPLSGSYAALNFLLTMPFPTFIIKTKFILRGWYAAGSTFEYWSDTVRDKPPPSGHVLQDVTVINQITETYTY